MADFEIRTNETFDLNVLVDGSPEAVLGLTYSIPPSMRHYATIDSATGILTPTGKPGIVVVIVKNPQGITVDRVVVVIVSAQQYAFDAADHDIDQEAGPLSGYPPIG